MTNTVANTPNVLLSCLQSQWAEKYTEHMCWSPYTSVSPKGGGWGGGTAPPFNHGNILSSLPGAHRAGEAGE